MTKYFLNEFDEVISVEYSGDVADSSAVVPDQFLFLSEHHSDPLHQAESEAHLGRRKGCHQKVCRRRFLNSVIEFSSMSQLRPVAQHGS